MMLKYSNPKSLIFFFLMAATFHQMDMCWGVVHHFLTVDGLWSWSHTLLASLHQITECHYIMQQTVRSLIKKYRWWPFKFSAFCSSNIKKLRAGSFRTWLNWGNYWEQMQRHVAILWYACVRMGMDGGRYVTHISTTSCVSRLHAVQNETSIILHTCGAPRPCIVLSDAQYIRPRLPRQTHEQQIA